MLVLPQPPLPLLSIMLHNSNGKSGRGGASALSHPWQTEIRSEDCHWQWVLPRFLSNWYPSNAYAVGWLSVQRNPVIPTPDPGDRDVNILSILTKIFDYSRDSEAELKPLELESELKPLELESELKLWAGVGVGVKTSWVGVGVESKLQGLPQRWLQNCWRNPICYSHVTSAKIYILK